ncbi:MAG: tRNA guanosine(34) transglycosylase Tgt [Chlorobiota bacterium]|nr:tRNA guanosine(34) transglycosylase Tgt [Chlorobiota bacterium]QQS65671.1 MAG: tRNA guanosine(34) transglycosylase Tgt [Chlorobiota bacterium]
MKFELLQTDIVSKARAGIIETDHGTFNTPVFMPVGTRGAVKTLLSEDLLRSNSEIILSNTYHLFTRPGLDVLLKIGGLHKFMNWNRSILTDSGGFQIFSLKELCKVNEDGVKFQSHIDGAKINLTPEKVIDIQRAIGSDIMMVLDEFRSPDLPVNEHREAAERSLRWAIRAKEYHNKIDYPYGFTQALFSIIQGGTNKQLREFSAIETVKVGFDGFAIGGLAVGEPTNVMYDVIDFTIPFLPENRPRYLMGVGTPENLLEAISRGVDMFDCVMPTRNARNATLFTSKGRLNVRNLKFKYDESPIDSNCDCLTCKGYSLSYIRHLFNVDEITACTLSTIHNIHFYLQLMRSSREKILTGNFLEWKNEIVQNLVKKI